MNCVGGDDFADEFQELQALVLSHANEVADGLRGAKPQMSYGGLMATLTFMLLLLWRRNR